LLLIRKIYIYIMHAYTMREQTSIRISSDLLNALKKFKEEGESYENVIWDFIEPHLELSEQTKKDIELSRKEYEKGILPHLKK
jgi:predicted CopG family antitoxin